MSNDTDPRDAAEREQRFIQLVDRYQKPVLHLCYLYLCDKTLAEDATQETFLKAFQHMEAFRGDSSEKTWIMKIAMHACYDLNHSKWFRFLNRHTTPEMLPDAAVPTDEGDAELTAAISMLPLKLREAILLYYFQGMTVDEIAGALRISQSSVSGRLKRGRERLKELLEGREIDE